MGEEEPPTASAMIWNLPGATLCHVGEHAQIDITLSNVMKFHLELASLF